MISSCSRQATIYIYLMIGFTGLQPQAPTTSVEGHVYLMEPISRNYYATNLTGYQFEDCPHCLQAGGPAAVEDRAMLLTDSDALLANNNGSWPHYTAYENDELADNGNYLESDEISVRHGICGDPGQTREESDNRYGQGNTQYEVLGEFEQGSVLDMRVIISTNHWGHMEFFICDTDDLDDPDGPVMQNCFNKHPLDRVAREGDINDSPIDPDHPGRYFVGPSCRVTDSDASLDLPMRLDLVVYPSYQLPADLICEHCVIQMVYYTGHSCNDPGYFELKETVGVWPSTCGTAWEDWFNPTTYVCGTDGHYPEEFWNCADVNIIAGNSGAPGSTTSSTTTTSSNTPTSYLAPTTASDSTEPPTTTTTTDAPISYPAPTTASDPTEPPMTTTTDAPISYPAPTTASDPTEPPTTTTTPDAPISYPDPTTASDSAEPTTTTTTDAPIAPTSETTPSPTEVATENPQQRHKCRSENRKKRHSSVQSVEESE